MIFSKLLFLLLLDLKYIQTMSGKKDARIAWLAEVIW